MSDMKKYITNFDEEKMKFVINVKERYNNGEIGLEEAKALLKQKVKTLKPYEIAVAEQELKEIEDDECRKEDIQKMLLLFEDVMDTTRPELEKNHPIMCYYRENDALRRILLEVEDLVQYPVIKNQWLELYDRLAQIKIHLSRKQNQLYSILEQKGFDRPTTTMWLLDNFVRDEIRDARELIDADKDDEFIAKQQEIVDDIRDLLVKEETVLYPTSLVMISDEEFEDMKSGDKEIGFAWIDVEETNSKSKEAKEDSEVKSEAFTDELQALLNKHGYNVGNNKVFDVATGKLTLEQINLIYKHMPVDLSYVDENELVCFYSDTEHRVFPRSKNVIGRDVKNCHPRSSVHIVEEIIEKFRSNEQNEAEFWINKEDLFIYIYYVAVRDEKGNFRGVLEMMQDCTHIRKLTGSQTLLTWEKSNKSDLVEDEKETKEDVEKIQKDDTSTPKKDMEFTAQTKLKDILDAYPWLKQELPKINPKFKIINSPLAKVMLPKATIAMMSERSSTPVDVIIKKLKEIIDERK